MYVNKIKAPCTSSTCLNGGTCTNYNNVTRPFYSCSCANGYTGQNCQLCKKFQIEVK